MKKLLFFVAAAAAMLWVSAVPSRALTCNSGCFEVPNPLVFTSPLPASGTYGDVASAGNVLPASFTDQFLFQLQSPPLSFDTIANEITNGAGIIAGLSLSLFECTGGGAGCTSSTQIAFTNTNISSTGQSQVVTASGLPAGFYFVQVQSDGTNTAQSFTGNINVNMSATPLPAALPLFAGGLGLLSFAGLKKRRKVARDMASAMAAA